MRDGIGSTVMITIIITFIVCASSYLAYNVNYTKAFRMKNKIISVYEDYNGICPPSSACEDEIFQYSRDLGYLPAEIDCNDYDARPTDNPLYCVKKVMVDTETSRSDSDAVPDKIGTHYYKVATRINITIPIFDNIFGTKWLYINGDTKIF